MCGRRERVRREGRPGTFAFGSFAAAATFAALVSSARPAHAASSSFAIVWSASTDDPCTDRPALESAVVARLGRNPFVDPARADMVLEGHELAPSSTGRRRARLEQRTHDNEVIGTRELDAPSCAELMRSAAFVIVLIVEPDALLREPGPTPADVPEAPAPPHPVVDRSVTPAPSPPWRAPVPPSLQLGAGISYGRGLLPGDDIGGALMMGLSPWRAPVRFDWRGSYRVALGTPRRRHFSAFMQEWRGCVLVGQASMFGGGACAGGALGVVDPGAGALSDGDQAGKTVFGPLVALAPSFRVGDTSVSADITLFFPRPRWAFSYEDEAGRARTLHELGRIFLTTTISVTRTFR